MYYCKRVNIRGGFNFAMFAVDDFSAKLNHRDHFTILLSTVICCYIYVAMLLETGQYRHTEYNTFYLH